MVKTLCIPEVNTSLPLHVPAFALTDCDKQCDVMSLAIATDGFFSSTSDGRIIVRDMTKAIDFDA